jgi:hypothetical protein
MQSACGALEGLSAAIAAAFVPIAIVTGALAVVGMVFAAAVSFVQRGSGSTREAETLFVGRWGVFGPELYLVGKGVRRLPDPQEPEGRASRGGPATLGFAREILAVVMRCSPAYRLAWDFAATQLEPLPADGFVMSEHEVEAWLEKRKRAPSSQVTR